MHELSVALSLVEAAERAAARARAERVNYVRVEIGALSGVVPEALRFGYDVAIRGTLLEGSELRIEETPIVVYCDACGKERELPRAISEIVRRYPGTRGRTSRRLLPC